MLFWTILISQTFVWGCTHFYGRRYSAGFADMAIFWTLQEFFRYLLVLCLSRKLFYRIPREKTLPVKYFRNGDFFRRFVEKSAKLKFANYLGPDSMTLLPGVSDVTCRYVRWHIPGLTDHLFVGMVLQRTLWELWQWWIYLITFRNNITSRSHVSSRFFRFFFRYILRRNKWKIIR